MKRDQFITIITGTVGMTTISAFIPFNKIQTARNKNSGLLH